MRQLLSESHKLLGWGLIATGVLIAYQQVVMGVLDQLMWSGGHNSVAFRAFYLMMDQVPQVLVCVVLILCGVWLVRGPRSAQRPRSKPRKSSAIIPPSQTEEPSLQRTLRSRKLCGSFRLRCSLIRR